MTKSRRHPPPLERPQGIEIRHARSCPGNAGGSCECAPRFRAIVYSKRDDRRIQKTFPSLSAAKLWREDALVDLRRGVLRASSSRTVRQAGELWISQARVGGVLNRSGDRYKPSVLRAYEHALRTYVFPDLGGLKLAELARPDVQALVDRVCEQGRSPSTVRNAILPLRAMCRRALARGEIVDNPTRGLELPAVRGKRERIAAPREAAALIAALPPTDRALWATAMYAGLRRGELQALRWADVDANASVIRVRRSWDREAGEIEPKSTAGSRDVPIPATLAAHLARPEDVCDNDFVFGRAAGKPFEPWTVNNRAYKAWEAVGHQRITLHECRHTYASLMIAAGVNPKALQTFMGHASITITLDRYGKLFPGSEDEAAVLLNAYLEKANA